MAFYDNFRNSDIAKPIWIGKKIVSSQNNYFIKLIKKFSKSKKIKLLEIGPGLGFFAEKCKSEKINYTAIEANDLMAKDLRKKGFKVKNEFVPPIKLKEKFDVIFMNQVFEHMRNRDEAIEMVKSCREHLSKECLLVISSPDILSHKFDFYQDYTHDYPTSMKRLSNILTDYGFNIAFQGYYASSARGFITARVVSMLSKLCYNIGAFHLIFGKRAYKVKVSLLSQLLLIGQKNG